MAGGWSKDGAVQDQIDDSINEAVDLARKRIPTGESLEFCEECEAKIPQARFWPMEFLMVVETSTFS